MADITTRETSGGGATVKGSPLTNAEVDTNFINLNDDKVEVSGAIIFEAKAAEALSKGDVVYVSGVSGNTPEVSKADADDASKMPAYGLAEADANLNAAVNVVTFGTLYELDTSGFSAGDTVYVSTTAGGLTNSAPAGESSLIQNIGMVVRSHASAGSIKVGGAGRTNATPNLNDGNVFIGNASNQVEARALTGDDISGGTITSFASTGIDDNATSTAITISSSQNTTFSGTINSGDITVSDGTPFIRLQDSDGTNQYTEIGNVNSTGRIGARNDTADGIFLVGGFGGGTFTEWARWSASGHLTQKNNLIVEGTFTSLGIDDNATSTAITIGSSGDTTFSGDVFLSEAVPTLEFTDTDVADSSFKFAMAGATMYVRSRGGTSSYGQVRFQRNNDGSTNLNVFGTTTGGDVLFYDDDGSTEGMRWDASANRLGIGESVPDEELHIKASNPTIKLEDEDGTDQHFRIFENNGQASLIAQNGTSFGNTIFRRNDGTNIYSILNLTADGDVIFYEDDGATSGLTWDASASKLTSFASTGIDDNATSTAITINSSQNVGIGTTDPSRPLDVSGNGPLRLNTTGNNHIVYALSGTTTGQFVSTSALPHQFTDSSGSIPRMVIDSDGYAGIGTTNPQMRLHVAENSSSGTTDVARFSNSQMSSSFNAGAKISIGDDSLASRQLELSLEGNGSSEFYAYVRTTEPNGALFLGNANDAQAVLLASTGYFGINNTGPVAHLSVNSQGSPAATYGVANFAGGGSGIDSYITVSRGGNDAGGIKILRGSIADMSIYVNSAENSIIQYNGGDTADNLIFRSGTAGTERVRFDNNGDVLVGNTLGALGLISTTTTEGFGIDADETYVAISRSNNGSALYLNKPGESTATAGDFIQCRQNGTNIGEIQYDGADLAIVQVSDQRLKNNIADSASAGSIIDAMQVRSFDWNDGVHVDYGFVAQELNQAYEPATKVGGDDVDEEPWGIKTQKLIPLLVKEIQDLRARVAQLEGA